MSAAHSEGDQHEANEVPEDHEGGDGKSEPTERADHDPHPYPRRLRATGQGATRLRRRSCWTRDTRLTRSRC
jgi:hypothetical protein